MLQELFNLTTKEVWMIAFVVGAILWGSGVGFAWETGKDNEGVIPCCFVIGVIGGAFTLACCFFTAWFGFFLILVTIVLSLSFGIYNWRKRRSKKRGK